MKRAILCWLVLCSCLVSLGQAQIPTRTFTFVQIPTLGAGVYHITAGPDGEFWFTEQGGNKIGKLTSGGIITEFDIPTLFSNPAGITSCPDGNIYFAERSTNKIGISTLDGIISEWPFPGTTNRGPFGIACRFAADDTSLDLYVTEVEGNSIAIIKFFADGQSSLQEFALPTPNAAPGDITIGPAASAAPIGPVDPGGDAWFVETGAGKLATVTSTGSITELTPPDPSLFVGITPGLDGNIWVTSYFPGNYILKITPAAAFTAYPIPTTNSWSFGITQSPDGLMDFTEQMGGNTGTMDPETGQIVESPQPSPSGPSGIASGAYSEDGSGPVVLDGPNPVGLLAFTAADGGYLALAQTGPPKIEFTKTGSPNPVPVGQVVTYTFTARNNTVFAAENCQITDHPTEGVTVLPFQPDWFFWSQFRLLSNHFPLNPGETKQFQLRVTADFSGPEKNIAELSCLSGGGRIWASTTIQIQ